MCVCCYDMPPFLLLKFVHEHLMLAMASPSFDISKFKSSIIFFGVNFDNARSLNLRLMRTLGVERSSEKICYVLVSFLTNILAIKNLFQIKMHP